MESERLSKLQEYKGERFFINKSDLPIFKNFIDDLLEQTLEPSPPDEEETQESPYFNFSDIDQEQKSLEKRPKKKTGKVTLSPQIKSMVTGGTSQSPRQETPEQKVQRQVEVLNSIAKTAIDVLNRILKDPGSLVAYQILQKSARGLKKTIEKGPSYFAKLYHIKTSSETPLIDHSKNVAVLCLRLGMLHKLSDEKLENLAIAAMIHDIGLTQIPAKDNPIGLFLRPKDKLSAEEKKIYWGHVQESVQVIEEKDFIPKKIRQLVEFHEETLSGSGPNEKTQLELDQQILALTNRYDEFMREHELPPNKGIQQFSINELGNYDLKLIESLKEMARTLSQN